MLFYERTFKPREKDDFVSDDCKRNCMYCVNSTTQSQF